MGRRPGWILIRGSSCHGLKNQPLSTASPARRTLPPKAAVAIRLAAVRAHHRPSAAWRPKLVGRTTFPRCGPISTLLRSKQPRQSGPGSPSWTTRNVRRAGRSRTSTGPGIPRMVNSPSTSAPSGSGVFTAAIESTSGRTTSPGAVTCTRGRPNNDRYAAAQSCGETSSPNRVIGMRLSVHCAPPAARATVHAAVSELPCARSR